MELEPALSPNITFSDGLIREMGTGKITLIGTFHNFNVPAFPFQTPPFFVTVCLTNLRGKLENFKVSIRIEEKTSALAVGSSGGEVGTSKELTPSDTVQIPFQIAATFPSAGLYNVVVLAQGDVLGSRDLVVNPVTSIPNMPGPPS